MQINSFFTIFTVFTSLRNFIIKFFQPNKTYVNFKVKIFNDTPTTACFFKALAII